MTDDHSSVEAVFRWIEGEPPHDDGVRILVENDRGVFLVYWEEDGTKTWCWICPDGKHDDRPLRGMDIIRWAKIPRVTPSDQDKLVGEIELGLAAIDTETAACPANKRHLGDNPCPKCKAMANEGCRRVDAASYRFVHDMRDLLTRARQSGSAEQ